MGRPSLPKDLRDHPHRHVIAWAQAFALLYELNDYDAVTLASGLREGKLLIPAALEEHSGDLTLEHFTRADGRVRLILLSNWPGGPKPSRTFKGRYETFRKLMRKSMSSEEQTWLWKMTAAVMFTLAAKDEQVLTAIRELTAEIGEGDYAERVLIPMARARIK